MDNVASSPPLARFGTTRPLLYGTLGLVFHLEELIPDDAAGLERACALAMDWFGTELKCTNASYWPGLERFSPDDLGYVFTYPERLAVPDLPDGPDGDVLRNLARWPHDEYSIAIGGTDNLLDASPYSLRFWAEIPTLRPGPRHRALSVFSLTVPDGWPAGDFFQRVTAIASCLRLRWGTAGLMYGMWPVNEFETAFRAQYAHARRHVGYDVGFYYGLAQPYYDALRSVSWLTFIGDELASRLGELPRSSSLVDVTPSSGGGFMLRAGDAPARGDANRLDYPRSYVEADAILRTIRSTGEGVSYPDPWTDQDVIDWTRRFERRTS